MCLAGYCVIMALHYYIENYCEKGAFYISKSHEFSKFKDWQKMSFHSEVEVSKDNLSADYVLSVEAYNADSRKVSVKGKYCVTKVFDNKGYFHIRKANDYIIDDILNKLYNEIRNKA